MLRLLRAFLPFLCLDIVCSYKHSQSRIPNGDNVPHPCKPNYIWKGVGHSNELGGGEKNPFGLDFAAAGMKWTTALCQKDSDGDGHSNGKELGDLNCVWKEGTAPEKITGLSHPGICEPYDSDLCKNKNPQLNCDLEDFKCDTLAADKDTRNFTLRFPNTKVPAKETNYYCMTFNFDIPGDYHMIATQPLIDNAYVMHHILLFGCEDDAEIDNAPKPCGMSRAKCRDIIGLWTVGGNGQCFNQNIGFRLGDNGYKVLSLQLHWNNPELKSNYYDSSGMVLHYTPKRNNTDDAGVLMIGQTYLQIPPGTERYKAESVCPKEVTKRLIINDGIFITRAGNHMHYLGRSMKIEHFRNGMKLRDITNDVVFSYDDPVQHEFEKAIHVLPGDELKTTCYFNSRNRATTVFYGDGTSDEMCFGFMSYYPAKNLLESRCLSWKGLQISMLSNQNVKEIDGCHFRDIFDGANNFTDIYTSVMRNCDALSNCLTECMDAVREARNHPCLNGDIGHWIKLQALKEFKVKHLYFFMKLESCDTELAEDTCPTCPPDTCVSSARSTGISVLMSLLPVVVITLFRYNHK